MEHKIWGTDINEEIEAVQNDFCKWILGISKKATNIMARGECGRLPLYVIYMIKPVKYRLKMQKMETTRYPRQCFEMLYNLGLCNNRTTPNWVSKLKSVLNHYGFGDVWLSGGPGDPKVFMSELNQRVRDCALQEWNSNLDNSPKCAFYVMFKKQLACESCLSFLSYPLKQALASFRCSLHKLRIEEGRFEGIDSADRFCQLCNLRQIENEVHFLFHCPMLEHLRRNFLFHCPSARKDVPTCIDHLFNSNDQNVIKCTTIFIKKGLSIRQEILIL